MNIVLLPGDGIGGEIIPEGVKVLDAVAKRFQLSFTYDSHPVGWQAIDACGCALPDHVRLACRSADAVLLGAVGLPDRDRTLPPEQRPERAALLELRIGLYANLRPIVSADPRGTDILIVRELCSGIYYGKPRGRRTDEHGEARAVDTMSYSESEIARIAALAFRAAGSRKKHVTSVDKANILACSMLWREVVEKVHQDYQDIRLEHMLVDATAPALVRTPERFDVLLTGNMFGDILSDLGAVLTGSLGMLPSACIGDATPLFEPVHGSAPDIAGRDIANPIATIMTAGMLLEYALDRVEEARSVKQAVMEVLAEGYRTRDIMEEGASEIGCSEMGDRIAEKVEGIGR